MNIVRFSECAVGHLIQAINALGTDLIGLELGVMRAESSVTILQNCLIKKLYLIDNWKPYVDYIQPNSDGNSVVIVNEMQAENNEFLARQHIKYSGHQEKVEIIKEDSIPALQQIPDQSLDFIFFDAMLTKEQTYEEAKVCYTKIKKGGSFLGHDAFAFKQVIDPIIEVKKLYNNENPLFVYADTFQFKI